MMQYRPIALEVEENSEAKARAVADQPVPFAIVNIVENHTIKAIALHLERNVGSAEKKTISRLCVSLAHLSTKGTAVNTGLKQKVQERNSMK